MSFTVTRPKTLNRLVTPHPEGSLLDSAGVVMSMLRTAALGDLAELEAALADSTSPRHEELAKKLSKFALTPEQVEGIATHHGWLTFIRRGNANVTLTVCDGCGDVTAVDSAPTKCRTTQHCTGKPIKAAFAKIADINGVVKTTKRAAKAASSVEDQ